MLCVFREKSKRKNTKRKLVGVCRGEKWAREEESEQKNSRCGRRKRKASWKTHSGSLLICCEEKTGRGEELASGKTHSVGVEKEKQARKPTPEAY